MGIEGRAQKVIKEMQAKDKVTTLSRKSSDNIEHKIAMAFAPIKQEFKQKERSSRAYITDLESGRINFYPLTNFYQRAKNYFSN